MALFIKLNPVECKEHIRNLKGMENAELNHYPYNGSLTYIDALSFGIQNEKKQTLFFKKQTEYCIKRCVHLSN